MTTQKYSILLISPYHTGSHKNWINGWIKYTEHIVTVLSLEGQYWKWRMHGGAITLAKKFLALEDKNFDIIICTEMFDLSIFLSMTKKFTHSIPIVIYFHENQLTYPLREGQLNEENLHYAFINYSSAIVSDVVLFNTNYHKEDFLTNLPKLLKRNRDYRELDTVETIREKSSVLYVGVDLSKYENCVERPIVDGSQPPLILWNARWEYDKNPSEFVQTMIQLKEKNIAFRLAICGETFFLSEKTKQKFKEDIKPLEKHIIHVGYASIEDYKKYLWKANITVSTAIHEFFGISVTEAIFCHTFPILPNRLSYPEIIPKEYHKKCLYKTQKQLLEKLIYYLQHLDEAYQIAKELSTVVKQYDWKTNMAKQYDLKVVEIIKKHKE